MCTALARCSTCLCVCGPSSPNSLAATFSCTRLCPSSPPAVHYSVIHYNTSVAASRPRAPQSPLIPPPHPKRSGSLRSKSQHREPPCARPSEPPQIDQHAHLPPASHEKSRRNCTLTPWTAIIHLIRASDHSTATITRPRTQHIHRHFTCPLLSRRHKYPSRIPSHEVAIRFYQDHMGGKAVWDQARKGGHPHKVRSRVCYTSVRSATRLKPQHSQSLVDVQLLRAEFRSDLQPRHETPARLRYLVEPRRHATG